MLIFECRFETFNIFCPLFFPKHYKHEIKNQTRQPDPNFNYLLHSKSPNSLSDCYTTPQISSSLCCPSLSHSSTTNATTIKSHHHHRSPHNPQPLQVTSHNTTKIRSTTISKPKSYQTHSLNKQTIKQTNKKNPTVRLTSSTLGVVGFSSNQPP